MERAWRVYFVWNSVSGFPTRKLYQFYCWGCSVTMHEVWMCSQIVKRFRPRNDSWLKRCSRFTQNTCAWTPNAPHGWHFWLLFSQLVHTYWCETGRPECEVLWQGVSSVPWLKWFVEGSGFGVSLEMTLLLQIPTHRPVSSLHAHSVLKCRNEIHIQYFHFSFV